MAVRTMRKPVSWTFVPVCPAAWCLQLDIQLVFQTFQDPSKLFLYLLPPATQFIKTNTWVALDFSPSSSPTVPVPSPTENATGCLQTPLTRSLLCIVALCSGTIRLSSFFKWLHWVVFWGFSLFCFPAWKLSFGYSSFRLNVAFSKEPSLTPWI